LGQGTSVQATTDRLAQEVASHGYIAATALTSAFRRLRHPEAVRSETLGEYPEDSAH
jgi:hypothetical protein